MSDKTERRISDAEALDKIAALHLDEMSYETPPRPWSPSPCSWPIRAARLRRAGMTDRIDHAAEAVALLNLAAAAQHRGDPRHLIAAAQVHASLALVEQQRVANEQMAEVIAHVLEAVQIGEYEACARAIVEHDAPSLFAEVRRLRAMETRVTMLAASWHYAWPGQRVDLSKSEQLRAALDGGE